MNDKTANMTDITAAASEEGKQLDDPNAVVVVEDGESSPKTHYSKLSVILMVIFSGLALGSDGYNAAVIGNLEVLFAIIYPDALTSSMSSRLSNAFLIGMIIGMLGFGVVADQLGRKTGAVATTILLCLGIILSTAASGTSTTGMFWMMAVSRGIAGVGAGGEYPVSGAGVAEATDENKALRKRRGFIVAMISDFSADLGYVFGGLVPLLLLLCVHGKVEKYEIVWRLSFALGLIPPASIFWFRYRMAVSTAYRKASMKKQKTPYWLAIKRYWRPLLGASLTWFLYNWIAVPFGIFASTITTRVNAGDSVIKNLGWGVLINSFYCPGPFLGGYLSDKIGRRQTMAFGFAVQAILGFIIGGANKQIQSVFPLFVVLYGIFLTFGEVGPGSTVVITSSECFPTSIRGQMMGMASAWSKAGAAISTTVFTIVDEKAGDQGTFLIGAAFAVVGAFAAYFIIPDVSTRLEDEDEAWRVYLEENGWKAEWGDDETKDPAGLKMDQVVT